MKKLVGISLFSIALMATSCQKEEVKMTETRAVQAPVWKSTSATPSTGNTGVGNSSGITDPNNDPDINSKKVIKQ